MPYQSILDYMKQRNFMPEHIQTTWRNFLAGARAKYGADGTSPKRMTEDGIVYTADFWTWEKHWPKETFPARRPDCIYIRSGTTITDNGPAISQFSTNARTSMNREQDDGLSMISNMHHQTTNFLPQDQFVAVKAEQSNYDYQAHPEVRGQFNLPQFTLPVRLKPSPNNFQIAMPDQSHIPTSYDFQSTPLSTDPQLPDRPIDSNVDGKVDLLFPTNVRALIESRPLENPYTKTKSGRAARRKENRDMFGKPRKKKKKEQEGKMKGNPNLEPLPARTRLSDNRFGNSKASSNALDAESGTENELQNSCPTSDPITLQMSTKHAPQASYIETVCKEISAVTSELEILRTGGSNGYAIHNAQQRLVTLQQELNETLTGLNQISENPSSHLTGFL